MKLYVHHAIYNILHYTVHVRKYLYIHCVCVHTHVCAVFLSVNFCACVLTLAVKIDGQQEFNKEIWSTLFYVYSKQLTPSAVTLTRTASSLHMHCICIYLTRV